MSTNDRPSLAVSRRTPRLAYGIPRPAITKIEAIVAIGVCLAVVGFVVMMLARHRDNAQGVQCMNNLRVISMAFRGYHDLSSPDKRLQTLPPARLDGDGATWAVFLAPHLTKTHPLQDWDLSRSYFDQKEEVRTARMVYFFCPTRTRSDTLSWAGDVDKTNTQFPGGLGDYACVIDDGSSGAAWASPSAKGSLVTVDVTRKDGRIVAWHSRTTLADGDEPHLIVLGVAGAGTERSQRGVLERGKAYTLLLGEKHVPQDGLGDAAFGDGSLYNGANPASFARIAGPEFPIAPSMDAPYNKNFGSWHRGICHFLFADGSAKAMSVNTNPEVLGKLARRGE